MDYSFPEIPDYLLDLIRKGQAIEEIRLDREGVWTHNGETFTNQRIIEFFNRSVNVTADGTYVLHYADYTYPIVVEDAPVFVTGVTIHGFGFFERIEMNLTLGETEFLDVDTLYYRNSVLYCRVRDGMLKAKFKRSPMFHILERLDEIDGKFYVTLCGKKIELREEQ